MIANEDIIRLQLVNGIGRKTLKKILEYIENKKITINNFSDILHLINNLGLKRIKPDPEKNELETLKILESCKKSNIKIISIYDANYPQKLLNIDDKPIILYVDGNEELLNSYNNIAVIGTRTPSQKAYEVSSIIAEKLVEQSCCIVSGLASGCDEAAHLGCLSVKGKTIAVIPSGHNQILKYNKVLYNMILLNQGTIISELPPNEKSQKYTFIDRNRIIAAISEGVIVIEGSGKGGTSHTVNFAKSFNKPVAYTMDLPSLQQATSLYNNDIFIIDSFEKLEKFKNKSFKNVLDKAQQG